MEREDGVGLERLASPPNGHSHQRRFELGGVVSILLVAQFVCLGNDLFPPEASAAPELSGLAVGLPTGVARFLDFTVSPPPAQSIGLAGMLAEQARGLETWRENGALTTSEFPWAPLRGIVWENRPSGAPGKEEPGHSEFTAPPADWMLNGHRVSVFGLIPVDTNVRSKSGSKNIQTESCAIYCPFAHLGVEWLFPFRLAIGVSRDSFSASGSASSNCEGIIVTACATSTETRYGGYSDNVELLYYFRVWTELLGLGYLESFTSSGSGTEIDTINCTGICAGPLPTTQHTFTGHKLTGIILSVIGDWGERGVFGVRLMNKNATLESSTTSQRLNFYEIGVQFGWRL